MHQQQNKARAVIALCHSSTKHLTYRPYRRSGDQPLLYSTDVICNKMELDLSKVTLDDFLDCAILSHGFTTYQRDYYFHVETNWGGGYSGQYLIRFKHCYELKYEIIVEINNAKKSWDDVFTDFENWKAAGEPSGFVWGTNWALCYPGFEIIEDSELATKWTKLLDKEMKQVEIETEVYKINFIYHEWTLKKLNDDSGLISRIIQPL